MTDTAGQGNPYPDPKPIMNPYDVAMLNYQAAASSILAATAGLDRGAELSAAVFGDKNRSVLTDVRSEIRAHATHILAQLDRLDRPSP